MSFEGQQPYEKLSRERHLQSAPSTSAGASSITSPPMTGPRTYGEASSPLQGSGTEIVTGGFDLPLMASLVEKLRCGYCHLLLRNPFQLACGDRICESCLAFLMQSSPTPKCPLDGEPFTKDQCFKDIFARREILALSTRCPSRPKRDGCPWIGKVVDVKEHEANCVYCDVECTNAPLCRAKVERSRLAEHLERECAFRQIVCSFCNHTVLANDMKAHQLEECTATPLPCPNGCSAPAMLRSKFKEHLTKCPLQVVGCYYAFSGCAFRGPRKDLPEHHSANMAYHLQLCAQGLQVVQGDAALLKKQNLALHDRCSTMEQKMEELAARFDKMTPDSEQTGKKEPSSASSAEGTEQSVEFLVLQQRVTDRSLAAYDIQLTDLNMRCDLLEVKTCNGILVWKIADFTQRRREALNSQTPSLYSPPFYTSPCGYKMCARLYPNGDGQGSGTHLSIFFVVMRGEFDALLPWPFQQRVTIRLLDQTAPPGLESARMDVVETFKPDPNSSSFHRPVKAMNVATGCPLFMPLSELGSQEKRYVRDDTIYIKVIVHPLGGRAPDFAQRVQ